MAKRSSRKMTANQRAYAKEVKRIKQAVKRLEKRGYRFTENVVPETPKRITHQTLQRIKELQGNKIYEKAQYLDDNTGKIVSGLEGKKLEAQERARKSAETRKKKKQKQQQYYPNGGDIVANNIVDELIARLSEPNPPVYPYNRRLARQIESLVESRNQAKTTILSLTHQVIADIGKTAFGWRLQEVADKVDDAMTWMLYKASNADDVMSACTELAQLIKGSPLTFSELQDLSEQDEYNDSYEFPQ